MSRALLAVAWVCCACNGVIVNGTGAPAERGISVDPTNSSEATPALPPASTCHATAVGRSYRGLAGETLERSRLDVDPAFDRLRPLPNRNISNNWELLGAIERAVGGDYHSVPALRDPSVGNTFGNVPPRWYAEADIGAFSLSLSFNFAFESCVYAFKNQRQYWNTKGWFELTDAPPTPDTAKQFCSHSVPAALSRPAKPQELAACVDTILEVAALGEETEAPRIWAYGCAVPIATPMFLTY